VEQTRIEQNDVDHLESEKWTPFSQKITPKSEIFKNGLSEGGLKWPFLPPGCFFVEKSAFLEIFKIFEMDPVLERKWTLFAVKRL